MGGRAVQTFIWFIHRRDQAYDAFIDFAVFKGSNSHVFCLDKIISFAFDFSRTVFSKIFFVFALLVELCLFIPLLTTCFSVMGKFE